MWPDFFVKAWNIMSYFNPGIPIIWLGQQWFYFARFYPPQHTGVNFFTIGFAYFANVDVLFSILVFHVLYLNEIAFFRRIGFTLSAKTGPGDAVAGLQSAGAFIALVFWTFWTARLHLKDVFRKALRGDDKVDDSNELMSHRMAVVSLVVSVVVHAVVVAYDGVGMEICVSDNPGFVHRLCWSCSHYCRDWRGVYEHADQRGWVH